MTLDPVLLSRLQWAWVISWHILLPAFTVGAASYIALLEGLHLATGRGVYLQVSNFWIRIFAVAFGMGLLLALTRRRAEPRAAKGFAPHPAATPA